MFLLGEMNHYVVVGLVTLFLCICILLILTVLIQKPAGGGLSGAFGSGAGSGQTAFGAKTGDALTIFTIVMFCLFVVGAVGLNYATRPGTGPAATVTPASNGSPQGAGGGAGSPAAPANDKGAQGGGANPSAQSPAGQPQEDSGGEQPPAGESQPQEQPEQSPSETPAQPK